LDIKQAVVTRKSIRGFKPDPVPRDVLREIIEAAVRAPSSDNSQPWEIYVLQGEPLDKIREENITALEAGVAGRDYAPYEPTYRKRQVDLAIPADKSLDLQTASSDVGGLAQTICLLALAHDLGSCILGQSITYENVVRKHTGIPESQNILLSIALGYPDNDFPANQVWSERDPIDINTSWVGFD